MNDRPWMTALEMQFAALRNARVLKAMDLASVPPEHVDAIARYQLASEGAALLLPMSETFAWSHESATAALLASKTLPQHTAIEPSMLFTRRSFWWFDAPLKFSKRSGVVGALSVAIEADMLAVITYVFVDGQLMPVGALRIGFGKTVDQVMQDEKTIENNLTGDIESLSRAAEVLRFVLAGSAWLQQRILSCSSGHVERHLRKRLAKEFDVSLARDVKVIQLRRSEPSSHSPSAPEAEAVEWSCRWIVNGHWRNQPYKDGPKLIYILPYVKGPDDKPLKVPTHTVYQVSR